MCLLESHTKLVRILVRMDKPPKSIWCWCEEERGFCPSPQLNWVTPGLSSNHGYMHSRHRARDSLEGQPQSNWTLVDRQKRKKRPETQRKEKERTETKRKEKKRTEKKRKEQKPKEKKRNDKRHKAKGNGSQSIVPCGFWSIM